MNGNTAAAYPRTSWWLIGTATTIGIALGTGTFSTLRSHGERVAVLEAQLLDTRRQLQRIERKLDHLLERRKRF
jgi:hypothetical protein